MDLSHEERTLNARAAYQPPVARESDRDRIARILAAFPVDNVDQWLALSGACPYWPNQRRERDAWVAEINRQRGEFSAMAVSA